MEDFYLNSAGAGRIFCRIWSPEGEPKAILQIVHGIAEHVGRYDDFARFLTAHGCLVAAEDHMGHGRSIGPDDTQGYFTGGWDAAVADSLQLQQQLSAMEEKLANYRQFYNDTVLRYDRLLETVPTNLIAMLFHFEKAEFFKVEEAEKAKVNIKF